MSTCQSTGAADTRLYIAPGADDVSLAAGVGRRFFPKAGLTLGLVNEPRVRDVMRGEVGTHIDDIDEGVDVVAGQIVLEPGVGDLDMLLPRILGVAESSDNFAMGTPILPFRALVQRGDIYTDFRNLYVNSATFLFRETQSLELTLDVIGMTATDISASAFATAISGATTPTSAHRTIAMADGSFEYNSGTVNFAEMQVVVNNNLVANYYASKTAQCIERDGKRVTSFRAQVPLTNSTKDLWSAGYDFDSGIASFIAADNTEFTINFGALHWPKRLPEVAGPGRLWHNLEGLVLATTNAGNYVPELSIDNNPVAS